MSGFFSDVVTVAIIHKRNQLNLATRQRGKLEIFENPAIFWRPVGTYCLYMAISERIRWKSGDFGCILFKKIICMSRTGIFLLLPSGKNSPKKKGVTCCSRFISHKIGRYAIFMVCCSWWKFYWWHRNGYTNLNEFSWQILQPKNVRLIANVFGTPLFAEFMKPLFMAKCLITYQRA